MFRSRFFVLLIAGLLLALLAVPTAALAHEHRTIDNGKYDVVVGWDQEPTYAGQKNGATIRISQAGSNPAVPVEGADKTLKVSIKQGASTREFPLRAVFGQPGYYMADLFPTRVGDYQWTFTGTINGDAVNETFDSADGKFDGVVTPTELQFPIETGDPAQLMAMAQQAQSEAQSARTFAYVGIGIGAVGLLLAGAAWFARPRQRSSTSSVRRAAERA
ncbi:MAG: hypothetical protein JO023_15090 [Chloroflexi bacterium]|nr:hypothetical protein [Chloroflexota bacterium]